MTRIEAVKGLIADLARPATFYAAAISGGYAVFQISTAVAQAVSEGKGSLEGAAIVLGTILTGVAGIYGLKAVEETRKSGHSAEVEKERAKASPPPAEALKAAVPDAPETADDGELPPSERLQP